MTYKFCVTGKGDFPFRMLSLCKAWPIDNHAAHRIALACPTVAPEQDIWLESAVNPQYLGAQLWASEKWPITKTAP